jgi:hypothetical protein
VLEQIEYAETGNESLLSCPQCGITKADLRDAGGYCAVSDPEGSEYISSVDCPYQKHFAPSHWLDEEYVVGHVEGDTVEVSERLPARVDMPKMKNPQKGLETMVVPYFVWDKIYSQFNGGITAEPDLSGLNYTLQFHGMMKPQIKNLIEVAEGDHDLMFGSETYTATVLKAEKDGGYYIDSATVRPYGAESKKMCIVCNEKPVDYSHPNTLGSLCSTPKCLHYAFSAETFESPATKEVLTLDEAFPSEWFEVPVIAPESGDERYKNCLDCGNPYLVENIRGYGWEASYSNHRPETNGMCDSSLDFEAETFGVEFDDWADQEMLTHGKDVSFKEWAKEEGKKHGDMDLTDWAEHEEESHDERYGAEEYEVLISDNNMDFGDSHKTFNDEREALEEAWKLSQKETDMFVYVRGNDGKVIRVFRPNLGRGAETFDVDQVSYMRLDIYPQKPNKEKYVLLVRPYHISKVSEKYLNDILTNENKVFPYGSKYSWANEQNRNGLIWERFLIKTK